VEEGKDIGELLFALLRSMVMLSLVIVLKLLAIMIVLPSLLFPTIVIVSFTLALSAMLAMSLLSSGQSVEWRCILRLLSYRNGDLAVESSLDGNEGVFSQSLEVFSREDSGIEQFGLSKGVGRESARGTVAGKRVRMDSRIGRRGSRPRELRWS
jgi:hypothetical protein